MWGMDSATFLVYLQGMLGCICKFLRRCGILRNAGNPDADIDRRNLALIRLGKIFPYRVARTLSGYKRLG